MGVFYVFKIGQIVQLRKASHIAETDLGLL